MPEWFAVLLLGIIEGITEFLPVSSTGHLLIAEQWLPSQTDLFNVVIQSGAVLAVIPLFKTRFHQFIFRWRERATQDYLLKILVAFGITGVGGVILEAGDFKLTDEIIPVAIALIAGGAAFLLIEHRLRGKTLMSEITWPVVFAVGFGQLLAAVFPGTSRSGTTILMALLLGLNRVAATEYTFLVGIPTMLAAGGLKIVKAFYKAHGAPTEDWAMVALGFISSGVVSFLAVKWLLRYVQTHTFTAFGWYRIVFGLVLVAVALCGPGPSHSTEPASRAASIETAPPPPAFPSDAKAGE